MGYEVAYKAISGGIFEFGASDAFMQMMAAFFREVANGGQALSGPAACPSPGEMHWCHRLFTAALESNRTDQVVSV